MAGIMRAEMILVLMLLLAAPAWAAHEKGMVGPYNVSFDMNTTMNYEVIVEMPSSGFTASGVQFTRYNVSIESVDNFAWLVLTRYNDSMLASIDANAEIVQAALQGSGCDQPNIYQPLIDDQPGVLGNCKLEDQQTSQGSYDQGALIVAASYSPDASVQDNGKYMGRTNCRIISTYPWETTRDMLYTLHVEEPEPN